MLNYTFQTQTDECFYPVGPIAAAHIQNRLALVYSTGTTLNYVVSNDALGTTWDAPVEIDTVNNLYAVDLSHIDGQPIVLFRDDDSLRYAYAANVSGSSWSINDFGAGFSSERLELLLAGGLPYFVVKEGSTLKLIKSADVQGTSWTRYNIRNGVDIDSSATLYGAKWAVAFPLDDGSLDFLGFSISDTLSPTTWSTNTSVDASVGANANAITSYAGQVLIAYGDTSSDTLQLATSTSVDFSEWDISLLDEVIPTSILFRIIGTLPAVFYSTVTDVRYIDNEDGIWGEPFVLLPFSPEGWDVLIYQGQPMVVYIDPYTRQIEYILREQEEIERGDDDDSEDAVLAERYITEDKRLEVVGRQQAPQIVLGHECAAPEMEFTDETIGPRPSSDVPLASTSDGTSDGDGDDCDCCDAIAQPEPSISHLDFSCGEWTYKPAAALSNNASDANSLNIYVGQQAIPDASKSADAEAFHDYGSTVDMWPDIWAKASCEEADGSADEITVTRIPFELGGTGQLNWGGHPTMLMVDGNPMIFTDWGMWYKVRMVNGELDWTIWQDPINGFEGIQNTSAALIGGRPAVAGVSDGKIWYNRAESDDGETWSATPLTFIESIGGPFVEPFAMSKLRSVNGRPMIAFDNVYYGGIDQVDLYTSMPSLIIANDDVGASWDPLEFSNGWKNILYDISDDPFEWQEQLLNDAYERFNYVTDIAVIGNMPVIIHYDRHRRGVYLSRMTREGSFTWSTVKVPGISGNAKFLKVNGHPAVVSYSLDSHTLKYVRALNPEGTEWGDPETLYKGYLFYEGFNNGCRYLKKFEDQANQKLHHFDFKLVYRYDPYIQSPTIIRVPAVVFIDYVYHRLVYIEAKDINGAEWDTPKYGAMHNSFISIDYDTQADLNFNWAYGGCTPPICKEIEQSEVIGGITMETLSPDWLDNRIRGVAIAFNSYDVDEESLSLPYTFSPHKLRYAYIGSHE